MGDLWPGHFNGDAFEAAIQMLESAEEPNAQFLYLEELCNMLCMIAEVPHLDVNRVCRVLVGIMRGTDNDNIVLFSCRALATVLDIFPGSQASPMSSEQSADAVINTAVARLCEVDKLLAAAGAQTYREAKPKAATTRTSSRASAAVQPVPGGRGGSRKGRKGKNATPQEQVIEQPAEAQPARRHSHNQNTSAALLSMLAVAAPARDAVVDLFGATFTLYFTSSDEPPVVNNNNNSPTTVGPTPSAAKGQAEETHIIGADLVSVMQGGPSWAAAVRAALLKPRELSAAVNYAEGAEARPGPPYVWNWWDEGNAASGTCQLLSVLHHLNHFSATLSVTHNDHDKPQKLCPDKIFQNVQLTSKLVQCLSANATAVAVLGLSGLPSWCCVVPIHFPFLFPFAARRVFLQFTSRGALKATYSWVNKANLIRTMADVRADCGIGVLKVEVERKEVLDAADRILADNGDRPIPLDVSYMGEEGLGLGPTVEFFTLVAHGMQKKGLGLWRGDSEAGKWTEVDPWGTDGEAHHNNHSTEAGGDHISSMEGLFPTPTAEGAALDSRRALMYATVGRFIAKVMQDDRLVDMHLASFMLRLIARWKSWTKNVPSATCDVNSLGPAEVREVDRAFGGSLQKMMELHAKATNKDASPDDRALAHQTITDMDLYFAVEVDGASKPLVEGGESKSVTVDNLPQYVHLVARHLLVSSSVVPMKAIIEGFEQVLPAGGLSVLTASEFHDVLCGDGGEPGQPLWTAAEVQHSLVPSHGYTKESPEMAMLVDVLCALEPPLQRLFLLWLTGSPRLPIGGLTAINPRITVVRKGDNEGVSRESDLPSCNTCFHYLKLPSYPDRETLHTKLCLAVAEGRGNFSLS